MYIDDVNGVVTQGLSRRAKHSSYNPMVLDHRYNCEVYYLEAVLNGTICLASVHASGNIANRYPEEVFMGSPIGQTSQSFAD